MHEHPNGFDFTTLPPGMRPSLTLPPAKQPEISLDENHDGQSGDFLDDCVRAASLAVDEARAGLTAAFGLTDAGLIDHAARVYKHAALLHLQAQQERDAQRDHFSTPPALTLYRADLFQSEDAEMSKTAEMRGDVR